MPLRKLFTLVMVVFYQLKQNPAVLVDLRLSLFADIVALLGLLLLLGRGLLDDHVMVIE